MTTTRTDATLTFTPEAAETIVRMFERVQMIGRDFGMADKRYVEAAASYAKTMADLFRWDNLRVTWDSDLSLFCQQVPTGLVFGLIFHGTRRGCLAEGCSVVINDDGTTWTYSPDSPVLNHEHQPTYPLTFVTPGTWSFHS